MQEVSLFRQGGIATFPDQRKPGQDGVTAGKKEESLPLTQQTGTALPCNRKADENSTTPKFAGLRICVPTNQSF